MTDHTCPGAWLFRVCCDVVILHGCHNNDGYFPIAIGDIRIKGGGKSGLLQFDKGDDDWGAFCSVTFSYYARDVVCAQLGYEGSSDVFTYD